MTLDVYSGLFDDDLGALAERMDAAHNAHVVEHRVVVVSAQCKITGLADEPTPR
jgi:hypothetical protein